MEPEKTDKEKEKLEKDLKTLVLKMKNENTALNKILNQLKTNEQVRTGSKDNANELTKK